jgi:carbonic anhydrase/acetyltransferase-like protein (isoleucine patch superfamily)
MIIEHRGHGPRIAASARVAPNATICGEVEIGENVSVGFGAVIVAESAPVRIGPHCVVMDTAVLRGVVGAPLTLGAHVMVGPRAHLSGCTIEDEVFVATGASIFNGAMVGRGAEVRINGVVHIATRLEPGATVPIGWVAVGDPARILPPDAHDEIWAVQKPLDFPRRVFGVARPPEGQSMMADVMPRYAARLRALHEADREIG